MVWKDAKALNHNKGMRGMKKTHAKSRLARLMCGAGMTWCSA
jgi:hypothetical protein